MDIFCLQEIWSSHNAKYEGKNAGGQEIKAEDVMVHGMQEISGLLSGHAKYFRPHHEDNYGLMSLVKNDIDVLEEGEVFVYKERGFVSEEDIGNHARNILYIIYALNGRKVTVINLHGLWNGKGKDDSEDRIKQSENILAFTKKIEGEYIICGDFNLLPDTKSINMFENAGLRNLIREHKILSTRTSFYAKSVRHADYIFVSPGVKVKDFKVLSDEVSDHSPLYLEFE